CCAACSEGAGGGRAVGAVEDGGGILRDDRRVQGRTAAADVEAAEPEVDELGHDGVEVVELTREGRIGRRGELARATVRRPRGRRERQALAEWRGEGRGGGGACRARAG